MCITVNESETVIIHYILFSRNLKISINEISEKNLNLCNHDTILEKLARQKNNV